MGAGKNKAHRKKRISKHVLKSQERRNEEGNENPKELETPIAPPLLAQEKKTSKRKSRKNKKVKDPSEAASYLSTWKHRNAGAGVWKFNKNTQSWLIRHMYEASKVSKATFEVLMEYLSAGGEGLRSRIKQDATGRAIRYKQYEKSLASREERDASVENTEASSGKNDVDETEDEKDETQRWKDLSDHDKRKEYKRSRKILDLLNEK